MVLEDRGLTSYPEYGDIGLLCKDWGLAETPEAIQGCLGVDWWCAVRRSMPYSTGSTSFVDEIFMIVKRPYGGDNFRADSGGKVLYVGKGNRKEVVFSGTHEKNSRKLVVVDTSPVKSFYLRYNGESYRGYRYFVQCNFVTMTKNKIEVHEFMQDYLEDAHPVVFPSFFKMLVDRVKNGAVEKEELRRYLLRNFKKSILAFKQLQKREAVAAAKQQAEEEALRNIQADLTILRSDLPEHQQLHEEEEEDDDDEGNTRITAVTPPPTSLLDFSQGSHPDEAIDPFLESILRSTTPPLTGGKDYSHTAEEHPTWISFDQQPSASGDKKTLVMDSFHGAA